VAHSPDDWPSWLKAANVTHVSARGQNFSSTGRRCRPRSTLGIAMGIRPYIDDDLAAGRLVAPFALSVPKGMRWYLVYRGFRAERRDFAAFRRWIIRTGGTCRAARAGEVPVERPCLPGTLPSGVDFSAFFPREKSSVCETVHLFCRHAWFVPAQGKLRGIAT
jgi:hypothetical protein